MAWKRILAVGCSHGNFADPSAIAAVLKFKEAFKPHTTIHLGDAIDCSAFMGSNIARGEGDPIEPDLQAGIDFLKQLRPQHYLAGNHEDRLERLSHSRNELVSYCAVTLLSHLESFCNRFKAQWYPYTGIDQRLVIGDTVFMHGAMYNVSAIRDHAESFAPPGGKVVHAHTHRAGMETGRRHDSPLGFAVGTLTSRATMDYAKARRATLGWSQGFVWGEMNDRTGESQLYLCQKQNEKEWRLPG